MTGNYSPRLGYVEPYQHESISHYLGRLRRFKANSLPSGYSLGQLLGVGSAVARWEKLYFNPFPEEQALETLANLCHMDAGLLEAMLPQRESAMQPRPILLCGACYAEIPCHRMEWQHKAEVPICNHHHLQLLSRCPCCKKPFQIPSLWEKGECHHCGMPFRSMGKKQRHVKTIG
ncbi:hypothetical protein NIES30_23230 [Phormidium tenue NIES-30]|uniref:Uncharacterized protein n=1 Tax=Phormidium tenue NIES-30 TaxID=549789 RepID=A0A1U7IZ15_9CYAN|nr:hypothetical protein NIES30_23230 [Phormidium tenue NIES-30]